MARQAALRGVTLGGSDHALTDNRRLADAAQLAAYRRAQRQAGVLSGIEISVGDLPRATTVPLELEEEDDGPDNASHSGGLLDGFDYVIASLHWVRVPQGLVHSSRYLNYRAGLYEGYAPSVRHYDRRDYFASWLARLEATLRAWPVTILGHFALLPECANARGTYSLDDDPQPDDEASAFLDATIDLCLQHDVAIEMNSKSRVPHAFFVARALERGARFSLGSDAHEPRRAGDLLYGRSLVQRFGIPRSRLLSVVDVRWARAADETRNEEMGNNEEVEEASE